METALTSVQSAAALAAESRDIPVTATYGTEDAELTDGISGIAHAAFEIGSWELKGVAQ